MRPTPVSIVLFVLATLGAPPRSADAQPQSAYEQASAFLKAGDYSKTDSLIRIATRTDTLQVDWTLLKAKLLVQQKRFEAATEQFLKVLNIASGHPEAVFGLTNLGYLGKDGLKVELPTLKEQLSLTPANASLRLRYAEALAADKQFAEAIKQYSIYESRDRVSLPAIRDMLVTIANSDSNHGLGERIAQKYAEKYPDNDDLQMRLGYFRMWRGKFDSARVALDRALSINPSNTDARDGLLAVAQLQDAAERRAREIIGLVAAVKADSTNERARLTLVDHLISNGSVYDAYRHLSIIRMQHSSCASVLAEVAAREDRIRKLPAARIRSGLDRLFMEADRAPENTEIRFRFVEALLARSRLYEAYDQLTALPDSVQSSSRWTTLFGQVDDGLVQTLGESPLYQIDRLRHKLRMNPANLEIRYALVDSLTSGHRYVEAMETLTAIPGATGADMLKDLGYQGKLNRIATNRLSYARSRIDSITSTVDRLSGSEKTSLRKELVTHYLTIGDEARATAEYRDLIATFPNDVDLQTDWVEFLRATEQFQEAVEASSALLERFPGLADVQKSRVLASLKTGLSPTVERLMEALVEDSTDSDPAFLLEIANFYVDSRRVDLAERLLTRIESMASESMLSRVATVRELLNREVVRIQESNLVKLLNDARVLAVGEQFDAAVTKYGEYFEIRGRKLRSEIEELARTHAADSSFESALAHFEALQAQEFSYDIEKEIANILAASGKYAQALGIIDSLVTINPRDYEAFLRQASALEQEGDFARANSVVSDARTMIQDSGFLGERLNTLESDIRAQLADRGQWTTYDFSGMIIPTAFSLHAEGGGTSYDRRTHGLRAEVTLPRSAVLTVGFNTHFISGSRRLVPDAEFVETSVNQIFVSTYLDLTPPIRSEKASYTNRLFAEAGLYDYEGRRSVSYFNVRFYRQVKGKYLGVVGLRTDEGSIDLWSAGGGEVNLRLMQFDANGSYVGAAPDSLIRLAGRLAIDIVSDNLGLLSGSQDRNVGSELMLEAGYKIVDHTYAGLAYHRLQYESRTDTYFSPEHWELTEVFLEHEREAFSQWYVRLRGAIGAISRSSGQMAQRLEADLIRRVGDHLSVTLQSSLGETSRALGGGVSSLFNRYSTFHITGSVRWTL